MVICMYKKFNLIQLLKNILKFIVKLVFILPARCMSYDKYDTVKINEEIKDLWK